MCGLDAMPADLGGRLLQEVGRDHPMGTDGLTYVPAGERARVQGTYRRAITFASGKFAVIQNGQQFTLVPWPRSLQRHRGREVVGIIRGMGVPWQLGRPRERTRQLRAARGTPRYNSDAKSTKSIGSFVSCAVALSHD